MVIEKIHLAQFRNYSSLTLEPSKGTNLFFGYNGSGKTNLLEAIHYCSLGKSHRTSVDRSVIRDGENYCQCDIRVRNRYTSQNIILRLFKDGKTGKIIMIDQKKITRFSELMGCLQTVMFSPEDLGIIKEGPTQRRRFIDMMISQIDREYFIALQTYKAALEQRNSILRQFQIGLRKDTRILESFNDIMIQNAEIIVRRRKSVIMLLSEMVRNIYMSISGSEEENFEIFYHSCVRDEINPANDLKKLYDESRDNDIHTGMTNAGPHREDIITTIGGKNMKQFASQGQIRTGALSLKLAQMKVIKELSEENPVLLLDDVMSELDGNRRRRLVNEINDFQTFITFADRNDYQMSKDDCLYQVQSILNEGTILQISEGRKNIFNKSDNSEEHLFI